jgi:hypothetical protein
LETLKERDHSENLGEDERWEDNIEMGLKETGFEVVDWVHLAQDRNRRLTDEHGDEPT